jgi:GxxExxY protein
MRSVVLKHGETTRAIIGHCFDVANELGLGFREGVYHQALKISLCDAGIKVAFKVPLPVSFRGRSVGNFEADLVVEDKILVEVKAVQALSPQHQAQVINYLAASGLDVGLLVNFGGERVDVRRLYHPRNRR